MSPADANPEAERGLVVHWTSHFYPLAGGVPSHIDSLCSGLASFRHVVVTDRLRGTPPRERFLRNAEVIRFGPPDVVRNPLRGLGHRAALPMASAADFIRGFRQRRFIRGLGRPVLHVHDVEWNLVLLDESLGLDLGGKIARVLYSPPDGVPTLLTKHFLFPPEAPERLRRWERVLTLQFPTIVCVDREIEDEVRRWADESRLARDIRFIPNSINPVRFQPRPLPPFDRLRVGFVARLDATRGEAFLHDLLSNLPEFVELRAALATDAVRFEALRARFPSNRVHLERNVPQDRLPEFYAGIHVLLNPLTVDYPVTRAALEAMACGRCVIMFGRHPRPPLVHEETALFVSPILRDVVRLLEELHASPDIVSGIGARARRIVEEDFSSARVLPKIAAVYDGLLSRGAQAS